MKPAKSIRLFIVLVFALPLAAYLLLNWFEHHVEALPVYGPSITENGRKIEHHTGSFEFMSQDGKIITDKDWENRIVVTNFFFTHCPVICPKMTINLKKIQEAYSNDNAIMITSFSVDPERDSVIQLALYAGKYGINRNKWALLTGDKKSLYRFARNDLMLVATDGDGGPDDFIHSDKLVLLDREKRIRGYYNGTSEKEVKQLISDIKKLKHEK